MTYLSDDITHSDVIYELFLVNCDDICRGYQANEVGEEGESGLRQHRSRLFSPFNLLFLLYFVCSPFLLSVWSIMLLFLLRFSSLSLSSKVVVLLTMAYVFLRVYSEGSSGRVYQCGIPERPLDCEPLYVSEIPLFLIISNFKYLICVVLGMRFFHWFD